MNRITAEIRRRWTRLIYAVGLPALVDRRIARRVLADVRTRNAVSAPRTTHLVISPPGAGNVGDQALFEAFVEAVVGPVLVLTRFPNEFVLPTELTDRIEVREVPDLIYGRGPAHRKAVAEVTTLIAEARSLSVIGADLLDGRYSVRGSVRRSTIAEIGAVAGVDTRIVGFSWNSSPLGCARRALVRAAAAGVVPYLRDPMSAQRARTDGVTRVEESADIVFSTASQEPAPIRPPRPYAVLNTSGLVARSGDRTAEYGRIVDHLRATGHHVVLLPHVIKPLGDDLAAALQVAELVGEADLTVVGELLAPRQVREIAAGADVVVTGRMHLAVMALQNGTPAVTLATQGKVEGLMSLFGTPELCVTPSADLGDRVIAVLDRVLPADSATRASITAALPSVVALARWNFRGLDGSEPLPDPNAAPTTAPDTEAFGSDAAESLRAH